MNCQCGKYKRRHLEALPTKSNGEWRAMSSNYMRVVTVCANCGRLPPRGK